MRPRDARRPADLYVISESTGDRAKRVDEIRAHVSSGSYEVAAGDVADALVAFFSRDFVAGDDRNADFCDKSC